MRLPWTLDRPRGEIGLDRSSGPTEPTRVAVPSLGNGVSVPITKDDLPGILETLRAPELPDAGTEFYVDWDGIRTRVGMLPWAPNELAGRINTTLPIPDDGYRSEDVEYACLAVALNTARETFRIVEVGAGWAPWAVAGVVQARRRGLVPQAVAVEADEQRATWAMQHAADNDVDAEFIAGTPEGIEAALSVPQQSELRVVRAAAWHTTTTLQFPELADDDMGGAIWTLPGTDVDYRGAHLEHHDVPAVSMAALLNSSILTDLLHVDVQGVEFELLEPTSDVVQQRVRLMAVGTQTRLTEGQLQHYFLPRGWGLPIDEPCRAVFTMTHPTLAGFTVQDGTQLWENPFLSPPLSGLWAGPEPSVS